MAAKMERLVTTVSVSIWLIRAIIYLLWSLVGMLVVLCSVRILIKKFFKHWSLAALVFGSLDCGCRQMAVSHLTSM